MVVFWFFFNRIWKPHFCLPALGNVLPSQSCGLTIRAWRETFCMAFIRLQLFPIVAVWIWHLFDLGEFISYLYRDNSYWNLIIQGLNWIFCLSCCRNFNRKSQQTHWSFVCDFILDVTPLSLVGTATWGRGKSCIQETSGSKCKNAGAIQAYSCTEWYSLMCT